jgi:hypothetical protein
MRLLNVWRRLMLVLLSFLSVRRAWRFRVFLVGGLVLLLLRSLWFRRKSMLGGFRVAKIPSDLGLKVGGPEEKAWRDIARQAASEATINRRQVMLNEEIERFALKKADEEAAKFI